MAETISLTRGATTIVLPAPDHPEEWGEDLEQSRSRAMGGRVMTVTRSSGTLKNPVLHWTMLTAAKVSDLKGFIFITCLGSTYTFTLVDWNGTSHTMRYFGGLENAKSADNDVWAVDLALVKE